MGPEILSSMDTELSAEQEEGVNKLSTSLFPLSFTVFFYPIGKICVKFHVFISS